MPKKMYAEYLREYHDPRNRRRRKFVADEEPIPW